MGQNVMFGVMEERNPIYPPLSVSMFEEAFVSAAKPKIYCL
jgi:hypothetical protein